MSNNAQENRDVQGGGGGYSDDQMPEYGANNLDRHHDRRAELWFNSGVLQPHLLPDLSDQPRLVRQRRLG
jgi:hypothetical protein